jgi:hypothetical protein
MMFFNVSIDDVLFWMDAIRNSSDRDRVLESFWKGQIRSKVWLIENLKRHVDYQRGYKVAIYGGWNGVLASLLYNSRIGMRHITSVDVDPACEEIASTMNKQHEMRGTFTAVTADMCEYVVEDADIVINTSCEHITQEQYERWLSMQPMDALIVLQGNNFFDCDEHIRCSDNLEHFCQQSNIDIMYSGQLETSKYDRYMIIGKKHVAHS